MNRSADVPAPDALLCESCGYILTGIAPSAACPECGRAVADSRPELRQQPQWETRPPTLDNLFQTVWQLSIQPTKFYRSLSPRGDAQRTAVFRRRMMGIAAVLFGIAGAIQSGWLLTMTPLNWGISQISPYLMVAAMIIPMIALAWLTLIFATRLGIRLTCWEARYRGYRLPLQVVSRAADYHSAHYLPVAIIVFLTVLGFHGGVVLGVFSELAGVRYLYILSTEVIFAAAYLFHTYWLSMRKLMYANG